MTRQSANLTNTTHTKLYGLDHLRTFAISFVFMYQYGRLFPAPEWFTTIGKFGWTGVDLFFVLSGYLISSQLFASIDQGQYISFKVFFIKKIFQDRSCLPVRCSYLIFAFPAPGSAKARPRSGNT